MATFTISDGDKIMLERNLVITPQPFGLSLDENYENDSIEGDFYLWFNAHTGKWICSTEAPPEPPVELVPPLGEEIDPVAKTSSTSTTTSSKK